MASRKAKSPAAKKAAGASKDPLASFAEKAKAAGLSLQTADGEIDSKIKGFVSTTSIALDKAIGRPGVPRGRITEVYGPEHCIDGDAFVKYAIRDASGRRINTKGGSLRRLWHRFHRVEEPGKGKYLRDLRPGAFFTVPSANDEGRIVHSPVTDVVKVGVKECFAVTTREGRSIVATGDHRFLTPDGYVPLDQLRVGATVCMHTNTPYRSDAPEPDSVYRRAVFVKNHPIAGTKVVRMPSAAGVTEYEYKRLYRSRAVVEAYMNGLDFDVYVARLNSGDLDGLKFLSRDQHVHHLDEDPTNDVIENLAVVDVSEHLREHAEERHNNLRFMVTADVVDSVMWVGSREVFDVKVEGPFHNFVANDFVVHNCGKTTLLLHTLAQVQRNGGVACLVDAEEALDREYAAALGVDLSKLQVIQTETRALEHVIEGIELTLKHFNEYPDLPVVIGWDSIAATPCMAELEDNFSKANQPGAAAKKLREGMRRLTLLLARSNTAIVCLNQVYSKIGVVFGNPEVPYGGGAMKYWATLRLSLRRGQAIKKADGTPLGAWIHAKIEKNKMAPRTGTKVDVALMHGVGIDNTMTIFEELKRHKYLAQAGSWSSIQLAEGEEPVKWQGAAHGLSELCRERPEVFDRLVEVYHQLQ